MLNKYDHQINRFKHKYFDDRLRKIGINGPSGSYLVKINESKTIKMNQIILGSPFHKSHTTRAIQELEERKLVVKQIDPQDQRGFVLTITDEGAKVASEVLTIINDWDELTTSVLTEEEKKLVESISERVYIKLKDYFKEDSTFEKNV